MQMFFIIFSKNFLSTKNHQFSRLVPSQINIHIEFIDIHSTISTAKSHNRTTATDHNRDNAITLDHLLAVSALVSLHESLCFIVPQGNIKKYRIHVCKCDIDAVRSYILSFKRLLAHYLFLVLSEVKHYY